MSRTLFRRWTTLILMAASVLTMLRITSAEPARDAEKTAAAPTTWKTYKHPCGAFFEVPGNWKLLESNQGIALIPEDRTQNQEIILAYGVSMRGVTDPTDYRVEQAMDRYMKDLAPMARRTDPPQPTPTRAGPGAIYEYRAKDSNAEYVARIHVTFVGDYAVAIVIVGTTDRVHVRREVVARIFASIGLAEQTRDPRLVGLFFGEDVMIGGGVTQLSYVFRADGIVYNGAKTSLNLPGIDGADAERLLTSDTSVLRGSWVADQGKLLVNWKDGATSQWNYGFEPDGTLVLRDPANNAPSLWSRAR